MLLDFSVWINPPKEDYGGLQCLWTSTTHILLSLERNALLLVAWTCLGKMQRQCATVVTWYGDLLPEFVRLTFLKDEDKETTLYVTNVNMHACRKCRQECSVPCTIGYKMFVKQLFPYLSSHVGFAVSTTQTA